MTQCSLPGCSSSCLLFSHSRLPSPPSSSLRGGRRPCLPSVYPFNGIYAGTAWRTHSAGLLNAAADWQVMRVSAKGVNGVPYVPNSVSPHGSRVDLVSGSSGKMKSEPFGGKSGSVSFYGLTYHVLEERQLVSSPFREGTGSFLWIVGPLALISSLLLPQFFLSGAVESAVKDEILAEIVTLIFSEAIFYFGLATFLRVADHVQRPYLEFSAKRWSLITGLEGYLSSAFFVMGLKVFVPLLAACAAWPVIGLPALVSVAPFLLGCGIQFLFESMLNRRGSSCWPLVPIIFEVYRLYQLSKAANFTQRLLFSMRGSARSAELLNRGAILMSMFVVFQVLGVVCLWSLTTFLIRLFPSRPVAENY